MNSHDVNFVHLVECNFNSLASYLSLFLFLNGVSETILIASHFQSQILEQSNHSCLFVTSQNLSRISHIIQNSS